MSDDNHNAALMAREVAALRVTLCDLYNAASSYAGHPLHAEIVRAVESMQSAPQRVNEIMKRYADISPERRAELDAIRDKYRPATRPAPTQPLSDGEKA